MANKAISTSRTAASTSLSGQAVTIFTEDGYSVAGSVITPTTAVALSIVEPGETAAQSTVVRPAAPVITSYTVSGTDDLALDTAGGQTIILNGTGFKPGVTVFLDTGYISVVNYISVDQISFTSPAKASGTYTIYVTNPDGGTAILTPGLVYSPLPAFTTAAGSLGSYYETNSISNIIAATADSTITYSLASGTLPAGSTLSSAGYITGTAPADGSSTTYTFTIKATDQELQDSTRSFSLTINTDVISWSTPTSNLDIISEPDQAISPISLTAISAANPTDAITYTANTLPSGVSISGNTISGTPNTTQTVVTTITATAPTSSRTATRTINWTIAVLKDPYFPYITTLLSANNQMASVSALTDSSSNNLLVTTSGSPINSKQNPFQNGYYSNLFDGSTTSLGVSGVTLTGDFTIECWIYPNAFPGTYNQIVSGSGGIALQLLYTAGYIHLWNYLQHQTPIKLNNWYHVALVRSGSTINLYINGVKSTNSYTSSASITASTIGGHYSGTERFSGYISNLRILNGTALYSTTFTPSSTPLTDITNTVLLTCQSTFFEDKSSNARSITVTGIPRVRQFIPFTVPSGISNYGSVGFLLTGGTNDYVTYTGQQITTSNDFCWELWYNATAPRSGQNRLFGAGATGANDPVIFISSDGTNLTSISIYFRNSLVFSYTFPSGRLQYTQVWNHLAIVRNAGSITVYLNGTAVGSPVSNTTDFASTAWRVGSQVTSNTLGWSGYISNFRVVVGSPIYTSNFTPPSSPLTSTINTNILTLQNAGAWNNIIPTDMSGHSSIGTRTGNVSVSSFSPYKDNWSVYFDGNGDYLTVNTGTSSYFPTPGTGDYTVEAWIMHNGTGSGYQDIFINNGYGLLLNSGVLAGYGLGINAPGIDFRTLSGWQHVAITRQSGTVRLFHNGVVIATSTGNTTNWIAGNTSAIIGAWATGGGENFPGYISNLRVVNGTAVYTSNFTVPTAPLTAISGTVLLTCQSKRIVDNSANSYSFTHYGDTRVHGRSPFSPSTYYSPTVNGGSIYFNGTNSDLTFQNLPKIGTGDYTVECWLWSDDTTVPVARRALLRANIGSLTALSFLLSQTGPTQWNLYYNASTNVSATVASTAKQWVHHAITRQSGTMRWFINGVQVATAADSYDFQHTAMVLGSYSSQYWNGYIADFRQINGTAVYTSNFTPPTAPVTPLNNTALQLNYLTLGLDSSGNSTFETIGDAKIVNKSPYSLSGTSYYFDGTGDYIDFKDSKALNTLSRDFTIEFWLNYTSASSNGDFLGTSNNAAYDGGSLGGWVIAVSSGKIRFGTQYNSAWLFDTTFNTTLATGVWNHIALVRSGSTIKCYINGVAETTTATSSAVLQSTQELRLGAERRSTVSSLLNGYISDLRITNGVARYTSNFSVPTEPFRLK